jgi:hypothetical protein
VWPMTFMTIARFPVASYAAVPKVWRAQYNTNDSGRPASRRASRNYLATVVRWPHAALEEGNNQPSCLPAQQSTKRLLMRSLIGTLRRDALVLP